MGAAANDPSGTGDFPQDTVLVLYLDAKIALAELELLQAAAWDKLHPGPYTSGRAQWAKHQLAAFKLLRRDAERPGQIIARYLREREKQCPDQPSQT
jgi:hypothetical protein